MRSSLSRTLWSLVSACVLVGCGTAKPGASSATGEGTPSSAQTDPNDSKKKSGNKKKKKKNKSSKKDKENPDSESDAGDEDGEKKMPKFDFGTDPDDNQPNDEIGCDIDFLFVVDNSVSMEDNQKSLADSVPQFIKKITSEGDEGIEDLESYHIGVISTDENRYNGTEGSKNCATMGGLVTRTVNYESYPFEHICTPYNSGKNFMDNGDDLTEKFTCAAKMGPMGSGNERPMDAIARAISPELTKDGACNAGFFRKDAILVVVLVTDEEDDIEVEDGSSNGSKGEPEDWHRKLIEFKDNRPEYVVVLSLLGKPKPNACDYTYEPGGEPKDGEGIKSAEVSHRLIKFTKRFGKRGVVGDVCADSYIDFFNKAVKTLDLSCSEAPK